MPPPTPLDPVDAAWLRMDRAENRMVIVAVLGFERGLSLADLREIARVRLGRFDRFRRRVCEREGQLLWEDDPDYQIENHVYEAPPAAGASHSALEAYVSERSADALPKGRPLWDMIRVAHESGDTSVIVRVHHCVADGMALIRVLLGISDEGEAAERVERRRDERSILARGADTTREAVAELGRMTRSRTRLRYRVGRTLETIATLGKFAFLPKDSRTALRGPLGVPKRVAWAQSVDVAEVKRLARRMKATPNDVLLATVAGGMRRYLTERSGPVAPSTQIRMVVPVNLRHPKDPPSLGNQFGLALLRLPVGQTEFADRCRIVHRRMHALRHSVEPMVAYRVLKSLGRVPGWMQRLVVRSMTSACSGVMTNVPGPREKLHFARVPLREVMFWVPRAGSVALGVSVLTYAGKLFVGFASDVGLVSDPSALVEAYEQELMAMLDQAPSS